MSVSEDQLATWAKAPSETEEGKCQDAVARIKEAVSSKFGTGVSIFLQGSYRNRTNVRQDSDVDVVVRHDGYYFPDVDTLSESDKQTYWKNFVPSNYSFDQFKNDVQIALENEFESGVVERKDKCMTVWKNNQRVNADVVPCFVHKRMATPYHVEVEGIELRTDNGIRIHSFPNQHHDNGVRKNNDTETMFKSVVRILKNVRNNLVDQRTISDKAMPSFFLECLVWNVHDQHFQVETFPEATRNIIQRIWNDMSGMETANTYAEVSDLFWLFKGNLSRTTTQARDFMGMAWNYIGFS